MPRGGSRPGAGRKSKGNHLNPRAIEDIRQKIKADSIIRRLTKAVEGEIEMPPSAVTAALGLLRKILPDLSAAEIKSETTHRYVARIPEKQPDAEKWQQQHSPESMLTQH